MDIKELQIGDLVISKDLKVPVKVCGIRCHYGTSIYFYHEAREYIVQDFQIEPIPLTPEILEKNGFEFDKTAEGFYLKLDTKYIILYFLSDSKIEIFINTLINKDTCLNITIQYVHELQHALKLCKIEKEVVL